MRNIKLAVILSVFICAGCSNQNTGTFVGATSGTLIGSSMSLVGAGVGLGVGALVGVAAGTVFDYCQPQYKITCENKVNQS